MNIKRLLKLQLGEAISVFNDPFTYVGQAKIQLDSGHTLRWLYDDEEQLLSVDPKDDELILFEELEEMLPEFQGIFCERSSGYDFSGRADFPVRHGLASFIRNNIRIKNSQTLPIGPASLEIQTDPVEGVPKAQVFNLAIGKKELSVVNYHGPALPGNKLDTPERIGNSQALKAIWEDLSAPAKILGGDFNLMPDTESIKILEGCGKNLIREFKIENTRNEISWKKYHNKQSFADFAFVSSAVKLKNFEVPYNLASDHLPMVIDFSL